MQTKKGIRGIECFRADGIQIDREEVAVEISGQGLNKDNREGFSFLIFERDPVSIKAVIGVGLQSVQQRRDSEIIKRLLIACLIWLWL